MREKERLSKEKLETAKIVTKTFDFLAAHYENSWNKGLNEESYCSKFDSWTVSMAGLTEEQVNHAKRKISLAECYLEFPPNPGQFRLLCQSMPEYFKAKPWVKAVNEKIPRASAKFNPDYDIGWYCERTFQEKTKVYEGALKAYPVLEGMLKQSKESFLDVGFERSSWFKPMIEAFRGYYAL